MPAIVSPELQERARAALRENKRRPNREGNRRYLLGGLVRCETCGYGCSGHATWGKGKRYSYYSCITNKPEKAVKTPPHRAPYVCAEWLEDRLACVRRFLENPGEVLERVREQMGSEDSAAELEARRADLEKRLATKPAQKDRFIRLYTQGHILEEERGDRVPGAGLSHAVGARDVSEGPAAGAVHWASRDGETEENACRRETSVAKAWQSPSSGWGAWG